MAREKGTSQFAGTYEVQAGAALDPRLVVDKLSDLTSADTWPTSGTGTGQIVYIYNGMVVSVLNDNAGNPTYGAMYELVDKTKYTSLSEGWKKLNTGNDIICNSITVSGTVTATRFNGYLTGDVTGNLTGTVTGDVTGNLTGTALNASKFNNESSTFYFRKLGKNTDLNSYGDYSNANGIIYINTEDKDSINSPFKYGTVLSLNSDAGSWMLGVATDGELRFRERWWSSRPDGKEWSSWVTILNSNNYSSYAASKNHTHTISAASSTATVSSSGHTHSVTAKGSVSSTFTGSAATSGTPSATTTVASSAHTHSVTAKGSVSSTFTGSAATSGSGGPSVTYDSTTLVLSITTGHTHSVTAKGSVSSTFTGSAATSGTPSATTTVSSSTHTHSVTAAGSVSSTFTGSAATSAASTATTTVAKSDHTHSITN